MRDAVIVDAVRTPIGKRGGGLSTTHAVNLSAHVLRTLAVRTGLDPAIVDDVIWGCVGTSACRPAVSPGRQYSVQDGPNMSLA